MKKYTIFKFNTRYKILFSALSLFICMGFQPKRDRIEILLNGNLVPISNEAIRVTSENDTVEIKVYISNKESLNELDTILIRRCYIKKTMKSHGGAEQNAKTKKKNTMSTLKISPSLRTNTFLVFKFRVGYVTDCISKYFYCQFESNNSFIIKGLEGFKPEYKFYYTNSK